MRCNSAVMLREYPILILGSRDGRQVIRQRRIVLEDIRDALFLACFLGDAHRERIWGRERRPARIEKIEYEENAWTMNLRMIDPLPGVAVSDPADYPSNTGRFFSVLVHRRRLRSSVFYLDTLKSKAWIVSVLRRQDPCLGGFSDHAGDGASSGVLSRREGTNCGAN